MLRGSAVVDSGVCRGLSLQTSIPVVDVVAVAAVAAAAAVMGPEPTCDAGDIAANGPGC